MILRSKSHDADRISAKAEDYLETILQLCEEHPEGVPNSKIADAMDVHRSTASAALSSLKEQGFVHYEPYGPITLTPDGRAIAEKVANFHVTLKRFFIETLRMEPPDAEVAACGMEHDASTALVARIALLGDFLRKHPALQAEWETTLRATHAGKIPHVATALTELPRGMTGIVISIHGTLRKRLMELGITPGVPIRVERVGPLGDPLALNVRSYRLSLRKADAEKIKVRWMPGQLRRRGHHEHRHI